MNIAPLSRNRISTIRTWSIVVLLWTGATGAGLLLDHHVSLTSQAMFYVLAVVIAAYNLGWVASTLFAVGAVTAFDFAFVPPRWTFDVESEEHLIALFTMLLVALVINHLAAALRRETRLAQLNERRAQQLQGLATALTGAATPDEARALGQAALDTAFGGSCVLALIQADGTLDLTPALAAAFHDGM